MNMDPLKQIVFSMAPLGSLEVYTTRTNVFSATINGYYWKDQSATQGYGPFISIWDTMEHYKKIVTGGDALKTDEPSQGQLIRVDFKNKKVVY